MFFRNGSHLVSLLIWLIKEKLFVSTLPLVWHPTGIKTKQTKNGKTEKEKTQRILFVGESERNTSTEFG